MNGERIMESPTTRPQRAPMVAALIAEAGQFTDAIQTLLELGAEAVVEGEGDVALPFGAKELASRIVGALEPEPPEFGDGERVRAVKRDPRVHGVVRAHYLNERGDWEYQVRWSRGGWEGPHHEAELAHF